VDWQNDSRPRDMYVLRVLQDQSFGFETDLAFRVTTSAQGVRRSNKACSATYESQYEVPAPNPRHFSCCAASFIASHQRCRFPSTRDTIRPAWLHTDLFLRATFNRIPGNHRILLAIPRSRPPDFPPDFGYLLVSCQANAPIGRKSVEVVG
jgi:hypothetical protein